MTSPLQQVGSGVTSLGGRSVGCDVTRRQVGDDVTSLGGRSVWCDVTRRQVGGV